MEISEDHEYVICKKPIRALPKVTLGEKLSACINKASKERYESLNCTAEQQVHQECRRKYCVPNQIAKTLRQAVQQDVATNTGPKVLRSAERQFNFSTDCFFCGKPAIIGRKRKVSDVVPVRTVETRDTVLAVCQERGDDWENAVQARILHVHDLYAADAVYHRVCSANFRTMKQIPAIHEHEDSSSKKNNNKLTTRETKDRCIP